jgi:DNA-binding NtrC family response regulator
MTGVAAIRTGANISTHTILLVEDEVLIRMPLAEYLRECGYRVFEAAGVAEAKAVLASDTPVDLVFTDVNLAGEENGFMLAHWVRQHHPATRVLLTSGVANAARKASNLCHSGGPMLAKPYTHERVLQLIQTLLRKARWAGQHA